MKRIALIALLGVLVSSGSVLAQDDFTFNVPINLQNLTPNFQRVAVAVFLFDGPAEPAGDGYRDRRSPNDPREAGGKSVARSVTVISVPPSGAVRQTVTARLNVANPERIESYSVVGYAYWYHTPSAFNCNNCDPHWVACDRRCSDLLVGSDTMFRTGTL